MSFRVRFDANGGTLKEEEFLETDGDGYFSLPEEPEKLGHRFSYWSTDYLGNDEFHVNLDTPIKEDIVLYAQYEVLTYTLTFLDAEWETHQIAYVTYGDPLPEILEPAKVGHEFAGWFTDPTFTERFTFGEVVTKNMSLYPKFDAIKYSIWFDTGETGPTVPTQWVEYGEYVEEPPQPDMYGYGFAGWFTDFTLTDKYDFTKPVTEDTMLFAKFEQKFVVVSFIDEDGNEIYPDRTLPFGTILNKPNDPEREGYTFVHWKYFGSVFTFTEHIEINLTLVGVFVDVVCLITYDLNGGVSSEFNQKVSYGDVPSIPETPEREGHQFVGWCTDKELTTLFSFNSPIKENLTIYAKWLINTYTVTFIVNGESHVTRTIEWNKTIVYAGIPLPSVKGFNFIGWYINDNPYDFTKPVTENLTIYGKFDRQMTTVTFDTTGGNYIAPVKVAVGEEVVEPNEPIRAGYTFEGWYTRTDFKEEFDFNTLIMSSTVLYAKWKINTFTVTISYNDNANKVEEIEVYYGNKIGRPSPNPSLDGYVFIGWKGEDNKEFNFDVPITTDTYIDATYTEYVGASTDDFLIMINSDKYYDGDDIDQAIKTFVDSYVEDTTVEGWLSTDFATVYRWASSMVGYFTGDGSYRIDFYNGNVSFEKRVHSYGIPLTPAQLTIIVKALHGISPHYSEGTNVMGLDSSGKWVTIKEASDSTTIRNQIATLINGYLREINLGNYDPTD